MRKWLIRIWFLALSMSACEDVYHPELDNVDDLLVVEARIVYGQSGNHVRLFKTVGFNNSHQTFPPVEGAQVSLVDNLSVVLPLKGSGSGIYQLSQALDPVKKYKLVIKLAGETFESSFEEIPGLPAIDTVYTQPAEKLIETGTDEAAGNLMKQPGAIVYADIVARDNSKYYRFSGRKIVQYVYNVSPPATPPYTVYAWKTVFPPGIFNIAAPPEYTLSPDIRKHPLVFLEQNLSVYIPDVQTFFVGWIYICQQYALSEQSYNYYKDLNNQLGAEGKLFDPLYVQARGNLSCITDPGKVVLRNFEISTAREHWFYVQPMTGNRYFIKRIPYLWAIPGEGFSEEIPPVWWESISRDYPFANP